jgi:hypothetical protein
VTPPPGTEALETPASVPVSQNSTACSRLPRVNEVTACQVRSTCLETGRARQMQPAELQRSSGDCGPTIRCPQFEGSLERR